jgi:hypothetical protein
MTRLAAVIVLFGAIAASGETPPPAPARREAGALVLEGIPEVPPDVAERLNADQNVRSATLFDWDPSGGILIGTRFGDTLQVHHVAGAGADRQQLTFFKDPVSGAGADPAGRTRAFLFAKAVGGNEFYQLYRFDRATGESTLLTDGRSRNQGGVFANAGGRIAYSSTRRNGKDMDIYVQGFEGEGPGSSTRHRGRGPPSTGRPTTAGCSCSATSR